MIKKIAILSLIGVMLACTPSNSSFYETTNTSQWTTTSIEVKWVQPLHIDDVCRRLGANDGPQTPKFNACARSKPSNSSVCEIYAVEPDSFDDRSRLEVFGHEVWHCLGARHK